MKNSLTDFIRHLRAAWAYACFAPIISAIDHEDEWTKEDSAVFSRFANSPTGLKLRNRARRYMSLSAVTATRAPQHELSIQCGRSSGITAAFSWQDSHLLQVEAQQEEEESDPLSFLAP